ncbi:MAG: DUF1987 domain-containing protein [Bacteroidia bacterium]|nr:DUF1987 domain-containing protein [Bacteroidia bacterium]
MEPLSIEGTLRTPTVKFNYLAGKIEIKGRSIMDNAIGFYKPLYTWLEKYQANPQKHTEVNFQLEYFNTASSKCLVDIFKSLMAIYSARNQVVINWYYTEDDDDMADVGEDFQAIVNIPFNIIKIQDNSPA